MSAADGALTLMVVKVAASKVITPSGGAGRTLTNNGTGNIVQISSGGRVSDPAPVPINASSLFTFDS